MIKRMNGLEMREIIRYFAKNYKTRNMEATTLNSAQLMILESFASAKSQEETDELMDMLRDFYARRLDKELERLWDEGILNQEKLDELGKQHLRTPYRLS